MSQKSATRGPFLPPRWVIRTAWAVHRAIYKVSGGRSGLRRQDPTQWGMMRLTARGRRSGRPRSVILAYVEDGPNLFTLAMNGWGEAEPAWWLNLQADPDAEVVLPGGTRQVRARAAEGAERERLWQKYRGFQDHLDEYAARRPTPTAVVVLEPRAAA
ncbi:nitroreductase/quinone reductase family protein [Actinoplanes utahensis]|uniref:LigA n=1 Tax=Actinoplanes utahensis TaxID=1869 RepID=A0A0A6UI65_ACTUT|nr:nitroreductase/quinone reductase family protein [Actinoplanes utahensis]KHD75755.1 LigA [Actinoplanes utahensis]GIF34484.1 hypothetical protein Aut01nite_74700 [Actinoplanes utahensis]